MRTESDSRNLVVVAAGGVRGGKVPLNVRPNYSRKKRGVSYAGEAWAR